MAYTFYRTITIDHTKVGSMDQTNFPVLISGTIASLKTVGNGGHVQSSSGYDIVFASDSAGTSLLSWEQESWNAATGAVIYWVKVPTVSHTVDTVIYLVYGDNTVSSFQGGSLGAAWDSNFKSVYHFGTPSSISANDSTSNAQNCANFGVTATTGIIGGAGSFNGSNANFTFASPGFTAASFTLEAWINPSSVSGPLGIISYGTAAEYFRIYPSNQNLLKSHVADIAHSNTNLSTSAWQHVAVTADVFGNVAFYLNGAADGTGTGANIFSVGTELAIGSDTTGTGSYGEWFNGLIDEARMSASVRSADWILATYNSANSPSTFYTVGSEQGGGGSFNPGWAYGATKTIGGVF